MYSIFHALDPEERLPRELILEGRRHRFIDVRLQLATVVFLPAFAAFVFVLGSINVPAVIVFALAGALLCALFALARRHKLI